MLRVTPLLGMVFAALFGAPAISGEAKPDLVHFLWTKICIAGSCFTGEDLHSDCALVAAALLIEERGEAKKILRVTLPPQVNLERGVRIVIGQGQPITAHYIGCNPGGCRAQYEGGPELADQLRRGSALVLEVDRANSPIRVSLPLVDFAKAYDGPGIESSIFEENSNPQRKLQEMKAAEEARKARCERAAPLP